MAGRHRRPPAWRRVLLRLTRSDRRARLAALQAEVVALRATVLELRAALDLAHVDGARSAAPAVPSPLEMRWVTLNLPLVRAALADQPAEASSTIEIDLREAESLSTARHPVLAGLPEAALLDPRQDRDTEITDPAAGEPATAEQAPVRRIA